MALLSATMLCLESHSVSALLLFYYDCYAVTLHISQEEEQQKQKVFSSLILPTTLLLLRSSEQRVSFTPDHAARAAEVVIELEVGPIKMDPLPK